MLNYLIVFGFFVIVIGFMAFSLTFSKYKKRESGCCGSHSVDENNKDGSACLTCPDKE